MSSATAQAAPQGNAAILKGLEEVRSSVKKRDDILDGLMKVLEVPAKKAGMSPVEYLAKMTAGGNQNAIIGHDGAVTTAFPKGMQRSLGGDWDKCLRAMWHVEKYGAGASPEHIDQLKKFGLAKTALASTQGSSAGYLIPPQFLAQLQTIAGESATFRELATVLPMTGLTLDVPSLDLTTTPTAGGGTTAFGGGLKATWTQDNTGANLKESEPTVKDTQITAWEIAFYCVASNTIVQDSAIALETLLTTLFSWILPWSEEYAMINGNGVGKPQGIIGAPCSIAVNRTGGASTVVYNDLTTMLSKLWYGFFGNSALRWFASQSTIPQLLRLQDGASRALFVSIDQGAVKGPEWKLFGIPIIFTEKCPKLGTKGDLILANLPLYLVGNRMDTSIEVSPHVLFLSNQTVWRIVARVGGTPWLQKAITLADGNSTVSPFVIYN
jgi:HK97 family phage major capsid protein